MSIKKRIQAKYEIVIASRLDRYMEMFKFYTNPETGEDKDIKLMKDLEADPELVKQVRIKTAPKRVAEVKNHIKVFMENFRREDAVMWALRKYRNLLRREVKDPNFMNDRGESGGLQIWRDYNFMKDHLQNFKHHLREAKDNNIKAILDFRFPLDAPSSQVLKTLENYEAAWVAEHKEDDRHLLEGNDTLIKFPNGWEWQTIDAGFCKKEGKAMRHCGNAPSVRAGDILISLREPVKLKGKKKGWKPHASFILHSNNKLGEMKGFANEKPKKELHPYIIKLLENDLIEGIQGGGYAADRNFALVDLAEQERAALIANKPELLGLAGQYELYGITAPVKEALKTIFGEQAPLLTFKTYAGDTHYGILHEYKNLKDFAEAEDTPLSEALDYLEEGGDFDNYHDYKMSAKDLFRNVSGSDASKMTEAILKHKDIAERVKTYMTDNEIDDEGDAIVALIDEEDELENVKDAMDRAVSDAERLAAEGEYYDEVRQYVKSYTFSEEWAHLLAKVGGKWMPVRGAFDDKHTPHKDKKQEETFYWQDSPYAVAASVKGALEAYDAGDEYEMEPLERTPDSKFSASGNSGDGTKYILDAFMDALHDMPS